MRLAFDLSSATRPWGSDVDLQIFSRPHSIHLVVGRSGLSLFRRFAVYLQDPEGQPGS